MMASLSVSRNASKLPVKVTGLDDGTTRGEPLQRIMASEDARVQGRHTFQGIRASYRPTCATLP